jgi:hypothetical protein
MATIDQIKKAILEVAGNPSVGVIAEYADAFAQAVYEIDNKPIKVDTKEIRVDKPTETR